MAYLTRMTIVSNFVSGIYLAGMLPVILGGKKKIKFAITIVFGGLVILGLFKFTNLNALKSIVNFKRMVEIFSTGNKQIEANIGHYNAEERREVKLYNPERVIDVQPQETIFDKVKKDIEVAFVQSVEKKQESPKGQIKEEIRQILIEQIKEKIETASVEQIKEEMSSAEIQRVLIEQIKEKIETASVEQIKEEMSSAEIQRVLSEQVKEKIETASVEQIKEEMSSAEIQRVLTDQVNEKIEMASVGQTKEDMPLGLVKDIKKEMWLNFEDVINEEAPSVSVKQVAMEQVKESKFYNDNAIFRLFIWRDMLVDLSNEKPILGFDFGKPLRSKSLEILHWGDSDWVRDGWIGAHNSYLHIIYRMGIVGIVLIASFLTILFRMIKKFISLKSLTGILLCGIIINWFTAANFLLIFELPYTAIPIWTLFGLTYAYFSELKLLTND